VPPPVVLGAAAALAAATSWMPLDETNRVAVLAHFGYFAFGAYYPHLVRRLASLRLPLLALLPVYVALIVALDAAGARHSVTVLVLSLVGVPMGVVAAVRLSGTAGSRSLAWLGQRTLQVYVLHMAVLAVVAHLPIGTDLGWAPATVLVTVAYPALMTVAIALVCLGLHRVLVRRGLGFLFAAPAALMDVVRSVDHDPSGDPARGTRRRPTTDTGADGGLERQPARRSRGRGGRPGIAAVRTADPRPDPRGGRSHPGRDGPAVQPQLLLPSQRSTR
jgi:hypothetical protein